jgi:hypothetical protein
MDEPTTRAKVLELVHIEQEALQTVLDQLTEVQMTQPGVENNWTVKDILAHIADWEQRMVRWIEETMRGEVPERPAPGMTWDDLDELNEQTYLANKNRSLAEILAGFETSYQQAVKAVETLTEEDLLDPHRFAWREGDPMWHMVAANTWWHYKEHRQAIESWLAEHV